MPMDEEICAACGQSVPTAPLLRRKHARECRPAVITHDCGPDPEAPFAAPTAAPVPHSVVEDDPVLAQELRTIQNCRLSALEVSHFGHAQDGLLLTRLDALELALSGHKSCTSSIPSRLSRLEELVGSRSEAVQPACPLQTTTAVPVAAASGAVGESVTERGMLTTAVGWIDGNGDLDKLKGEADYYFKARQYEKAVEKYTIAIEIRPAWHVLYSNRSAAHLGAVHEHELTNGASKTHLACHNPRDGSQLNLNWSREARLHKRGALVDAVTCVQVEPQFVKGYSRQGAALHELKLLDEAMHSYDLGLALDPTNRGLLQGVQKLHRPLYHILHHLLFIVLLDSFFDFHDRDNTPRADVLCDSNPNLLSDGHKRHPKVLEAAASVQRKKREANISMAAGMPAAALSAYLLALAEAQAADLGLLCALLHANIAAAYLACGDPAAAEGHARTSTQLDRCYMHGYARLVRAFLQQNDDAQAQLFGVLKLVQPLDLWEVPIQELSILANKLVVVLKLGGSLSQLLAKKLSQFVHEAGPTSQSAQQGLSKIINFMTHFLQDEVD